MNNFVIPIQPITPPKRRRRSQLSIPSKSKYSNHSLQLPNHVNPPEIQINGGLSHRSRRPKQSFQIVTTIPLTSRRKSIKRIEQIEKDKKKQKMELPNIFLVRHKNNRRAKDKHLRSKIETQEQLKPKRDFDIYLTYIRSNSQKYFVPRNKKKQESQLNIQIIKTIQYIFLKLSSSLQSSGENIKDLSIVYLSLHGKSQIQYCLYLQINQPSIHKLFILQRLICYYIVILYGSNKFNSYIQLFTKASYYSYNYLRSMIQYIQGKESKQGIGSTVRSLKLACEVDKGVEQIIHQLKLLAKPLSRELYQADKQLVSLIHSITQINFLQKLTKLQLTLNWKLFKLPPIPYLPPSTYTYTILLQLDTTITYYNQTKKLLMFRPCLQQFLDIIKPRFEVVLFTIAIKQYADKVIQQMDTFDRIFESRLYNQHVSMSQGHFFKDLSKLGRDLTKVLILDSQSKYLKSYSDNCIQISKWFGNEFDDELNIIAEVLKDLVDRKVTDIRGYLRSSKPVLTHISEQPQQTIQSNI